ncbi:MAG TPA: hypothetical protein VN893_13955 [Bryobacteraceae bacterium]|nr:hypothetical protein [Bryobacteraceae bacterium]
MKKKLLLLDLALAVLVVVLVGQVRDRLQEARKRSDVMFGKALKQLPPPPYSALPAVPAVTAAGYSAVALKYPFSPDRNPTVIVDPPKETPMPPLPIYYGIMTLSDGDTAIMSAKMGDPSLGIHFGEKVGEFTLVAVADDVVTLEWNGKTVTRKVSELRPHLDMGKVAAAARPTETTPKPAPQPGSKVEASPWDEIGPNLRACRPGDSSPAGSEKDGWRKVMVPTPMGSSCHWERGN